MEKTKKRVLLIDADVLAYQACAGTEKVICFDGDNCFPIGSLTEAMWSFSYRMEFIKDTLGTKDAILCFSGDTGENFRRGLYPPYKANRVGKPKPVALSALREACEVDLYTDSKYVCDAVEKGWLAGWQKRNWIKSDKKPVLNVDLWKQLLPLLRTHKVTFHWLRGHAGHRENERCDELARAFAAGPDLPEDTGFTAAQA